MARGRKTFFSWRRWRTRAADHKFDPPGSQTINKETVKPAITKYLNPANAVIIYAWNENDEGGWLIPTLKTDGTADTGRVDAAGKVLARGEASFTGSGDACNASRNTESISHVMINGRLFRASEVGSSDRIAGPCRRAHPA